MVIFDLQNVGIDKGDIPDLTKAPSSLLDALEQHLASVEGKKGSAASTPTQSAKYVAMNFNIYSQSVKYHQHFQFIYHKNLIFDPFHAKMIYYTITIPNLFWKTIFNN